MVVMGKENQPKVTNERTQKKRQKKSGHISTNSLEEIEKTPKLKRGPLQYYQTPVDSVPSKWLK